MVQKQVNIKTIKPDDATRAGEFALLPVNEQPPVITSHPIRNFNQLTWTSLSQNGQQLFKEIKPTLDTFTIRKGTALSWTFYCIDPSNLDNINDTSNLTFKWKRNGYDLYNFNRQNQGRGVALIEYTEQQCTEELEGEYVCEVSNEFGTTSTIPFTIRILDIDNSKRLYSNLIINGDADGGLEGWVNLDGKITTTTGKDKVIFNQNTTTTYLEYYPISTGSNYLPPLPFKFNTNISENHLFYKGYKQWLDATKGDILNYNIQTDKLAQLPGWLKWSSINQRASVIPNEDYQRISTTRQGFFPGPHYIDTYNRNNLAQKSIGLSSELSNTARPVNYFTRDVIEFGENASTDFSQTIPLNDLGDLIKGEVGGVDYLTAQLFAYVGVALSRCTIKVIVGGIPREYNWLVHDLVTYRRFLRGTNIDKIIPDQGTPIEIIQHADDTTSLVLDILDGSGRVVKSEVVNGPQALDLWAVREKTDFALTLFPIFMFFENRNNPIQVFGQTYTNTSALSQLFETRGNTGYLSTVNVDFIQSLDVNVQFLAKRYGQLIQAEYGELWEDEGAFYSNVVDGTRQKRAVNDIGVQAFFGVGINVDLPTTANSLKLTIQFTNNSPARLDTSPESKGWSARDIYNTIFNVSSTTVDGEIAPTSDPLYRYGNPRCAVTKIKLQIVPNRDIASPKHSTYALPPLSSTVLGIARALAFSPANDATIRPTFSYNLIQPQGVPPAPNPTLDQAQQQEIEVAREFDRNSTAAGNLNPQSTPPLDVSEEDLKLNRNFSKDSIDVEEADRLAGDVVGVDPDDI